MPKDATTRLKLGLLGAACVGVGWIGSAFLGEKPKGNAEDGGSIESLKRRPNYTLSADSAEGGPMFREWFASLKKWSRSARPTQYQLGELRSSAKSVRVNSAGSKLVEAMAKAVTDELAAKGTSGSSTSLAAAAEIDFKKAFLAISSTEKKAEQNDVTAVVGTYAARKPVEAIDSIRERNLEPDQERTLLWIAFPYWALADGEAAFEAALSSGQDRYFLNAIIYSWALSEPAKAGAAIIKHRKKLVYGAGEGGSGWGPEKFCRIFLQHSSAAATNWIKGIQDEGFRHLMTKAMIPELAAIDSTQALSFLEELPPGLGLDYQQQTYGKFIDRWANANPRAVLQWAGEQKDHRKKCAAVGKALAALARVSTEEAADAIKKLPAPKHTHDQRGNPLVYVDHEYINACQHVARSLIESDPAEAEKWLNSLSDDALEVAMPAVYNSAWQTLDPTNAWDYISTKPEDKAKAEVLPQLIAQRALSEPAEALQLAASLEEGATRAFSIRNVLLELAKVDPDRAREFVSNMEPSASRDLAIQEVAQTIATDDPAEALTMSAQIQDPPRRSMVSANAIASLGELDPEEALRRLDGPEGAGITVDWQREKLRERLQRSGEIRAFLRRQ